MSESSLTIFQKIRQNHALEHATMHILARRIQGLSLYAFSDWRGFTVYGNVETTALIDAVVEGLHRLREGEASLAIHPRCGTNLAVPLGVTGGLALTALYLPRSWRLIRFASALLAGAAFGLRKPLSIAVQKYMTTTTNLEPVRVAAVQRTTQGNVQVHRVLLSS